MTPSWSGLFSGRSFSAGDPGVRFEFALGLPAWGWFLVGIACVGAAVWCYWRIAGTRVWRIGLATLRAMTLLLLAFLIAGPRLVRQPERTERDWVVMLADRSASMSVPDVETPQGRVTRDEQLGQAMTAAAPTLEKLAGDRSVLWLGFDSGAFDLPSPQAPGSPWAGASGRRTELSRPIEQALQRVAARPVSGLVIYSDGRLASPISRSVTQKLQAEQIPVFVVPLGSGEEVPDIAVDRVEAPSRAFVDDIVPVNVRLERSGASGKPWTGKVQLVETQTGVVLDERDLSAQDTPPTVDRMELSLASRPSATGKSSWTVRLDPGSADLTRENNSKAVSIDLTDRSIRVIYFDGYPRWEYRYMRGLLVREHSIRSSTLLLSASRKYLQEGSEQLVTIPSSAGEWGAVDVVVIGDVRADLFSAEQLENLKMHIARDGAGLLWIAGPSATPDSWRNSPLGDLLPFTLATDSGSSPVVPSSQPAVISPTPAAGRLGLLRLGESGQIEWPIVLSDPDSGWSRLWWSQKIDPGQVKPTAEILATLGAEPGSAEQWPAVLTMRYGSGRSVYVATDEIWRWRFGRGEALYERFWLPIIRLLARESLAATGQAAVLEVVPDQPVVDQPVRVWLRVVDESISGRLPQKISVRVRRAGAPVDDPGTELALLPEAAGDGRPVSFATTWTPSDAGRFEFTVSDAALAGTVGGQGPPTATAEVVTDDDERRTPQADHSTLAALAAATGGAVIPPDQLASLAEKLPNRQVRVFGTPEIDPLWDRPVIFVVLMILLTAEWLGRKWLRLA
ncbi:MAG: hypothetical protein GIKADHBN_00763 [Phycisphaerales bacterium]|nr:hypothetical protein [Phycisphaerales bacterium]